MLLLCQIGSEKQEGLNEFVGIAYKFKNSTTGVTNQIARMRVKR